MMSSCTTSATSRRINFGTQSQQKNMLFLMTRRLCVGYVVLCDVTPHYIHAFVMLLHLPTV